MEYFIPGPLFNITCHQPHSPGVGWWWVSRPLYWYVRIADWGAVYIAKLFRLRIYIHENSPWTTIKWWLRSSHRNRNTNINNKIKEEFNSTHQHTPLEIPWRIIQGSATTQLTCFVGGGSDRDTFLVGVTAAPKCRVPVNRIWSQSTFDICLWRVYRTWFGSTV